MTKRVVGYVVKEQGGYYLQYESNSYSASWTVAQCEARRLTREEARDIAARRYGRVVRLVRRRKG